MPNWLTSEITESIINCHRRHGWRAEKEARFSPRRIDVLAISPGGSEVVAFEVKISRCDFRNELKEPLKRTTVMRHCSQFYFVVPYGMIFADEVPEDCGLIYYGSGWLCLEKPSPGKTSPLPFEVDILAWRKRSEEKLALEAWRLHTEDSYNPIAEHFSGLLPGWMSPWFRKPLRFQFDVINVASKMATAHIPTLAIDFDQVPF